MFAQAKDLRQRCAEEQENGNIADDRKEGENGDDGVGRGHGERLKIEKQV